MLKPWFRVLIDGPRVLLEFAGALVILEGGAAQRLLPTLLPLLDGTRTVETLVEHLGTAIESAVRGALAELARRGALTDGPALPDSLPGPVAAAATLVASSAGSSPAQVVERLERSRVGLVGEGVLLRSIAELIHRCGVESIEQVEPRHLARGRLDLVVAAGSTPASLDDLNRAALRESVPWLAISEDGRIGWIGPLVVPGETCCWRCFRLRRAATSGYADEALALETASRPELTAPPLTATVAGLAATLAVRWLGARDPALPGAAWALALWPRPTLTEQITYRVPRCPECSGLDGKAAPAPWAEEEAAA